MEELSPTQPQEPFMLSIFLDMETTGLDPTRHVPIELAFRVINMADGKELASYSTLIRPIDGAWERRDTRSMEINGISEEELAHGKEPAAVRDEVIEIFTSLGVERERAVFICQNPSFDRSFFAQLIDVYKQQELNWPYHWLDFASMFWGLVARKAYEGHIAFPYKMNLSKNAIAHRYQIPPEENPHRALNGVDHLVLCYKTAIGLPS